MSTVEFHKEFNTWYLKPDVAVINLSRPAKLSEKVNTICLPPHGSRVKLGTKCFVTGKKIVTKPRVQQALF